jgi:hypothetical protein
MTATHYDSDAPKSAYERELEEVVRRLAYRLLEAREDSAEYRMIERQMEGIRHGSELGGLLMQEYDMSGIDAVNHW